MTDDSRSADDLVTRIHAELAATEELPIERRASRWVGEAQAVAGDLVGADLPADIVHERVGHVNELLSHVDSTGHDRADEHVATARELATRLLDEG